MAEDLRRFKQGRPGQDRPAGRLERGIRWCRRNPATATLLALAAVAGACGLWWEVGLLLALAAVTGSSGRWLRLWKR